MKELKKRCLIEFWYEKGCLAKRSRFTVKVNELDVAYWRLPDQWRYLFNHTAVYLCLNREWLSARCEKDNVVRFVSLSSWERSRAWFKEGVTSL